MAVANICGFETGDSSEFIAVVGTQSVVTSPVRSGTYAGRVNPTTTATGYFDFTKAAFSNFLVATIYVRFYFYVATLPASSSEEILHVQETTPGYKVALRINSAGNLMLFDKTGTVQIGSTGSTALSTATWYRIELVVPAGTSATVDVYLDGVSEISGTGDTTVNNARRVRFGKGTNRNGQTIDVYYDDISVSDSALPGAGACLRMDPDGDGDTTAWTIGAGSGAEYLQVDEVPPDGDTTYLVSTLAVGDASLVTLESTSSAGISGTINAVKVVGTCKQDGAAAGTFKTRCRNGTTNSDSASMANTSAYQSRGDMFATDPNTGAAWTTGGLDTAQAGVVENETTDKTRCTAVYMMVDWVAAAAPATLPTRLTLMGVGN